MTGEAAPVRLTLGVMGHVDHGKTALVKALTGMDTDRLPEEKRRGLSIALGFAHARVGGLDVDFIDMPGHERFVRTLVSGATGVDAVLLVVAANEGIKPQTLEHLDIAALLRLDRVLPVITKADLVDGAARAAIADQVAEAMAHTGLSPAVPPAEVPAVSTRDGRGLDTLSALLSRMARSRAQDDDGFPWLPIDRAFTIPGRGTVVTGTLRRGRLDAGGPLALHPQGRAVRVRGLQVHGRAADGADPGQRVAANLRELDPGQAPRGSALAPPDCLTPSRRLTVILRAPAGGPELRTGAAVRLLIGAQEAGGRLRLLEGDALGPGAQAFAQIETRDAIAVPAGERFILRRPSPSATLAGGEVIDPAATRLRRCDETVLASLAALTSVARAARPAVRLVVAGPEGETVERLAQLAGVAPARIAAQLPGLAAVDVGGGRLVLRTALQALGHRALDALGEALDAHPAGMSRRALAGRLGDPSAEVLDAALEDLATAGRVRLEAAAVRLPPPRAQAEAEAARALALARTLAERLRRAGLSPPDPAELAPDPASRRALEALVKSGVGVRARDQVQKRELVFHRDAVAAARASLAPHLAPPGLTVGEAGTKLGVSRKFSVPLLEHLDAVRFTRRLGDRRVLGPAAAP